MERVLHIKTLKNYIIYLNHICCNCCHLEHRKIIRIFKYNSHRINIILCKIIDEREDVLLLCRNIFFANFARICNDTIVFVSIIRIHPLKVEVLYEMTYDALLMMLSFLITIDKSQNYFTEDTCKTYRIHINAICSDNLYSLFIE